MAQSVFVCSWARVCDGVCVLCVYECGVCVCVCGGVCVCCVCAACECCVCECGVCV